MGALHRLCRIVALTAALTALGGSFARAEDEKVTLGTVGQASANLWPVLIGMQKGFFAAEGVAPEIVYVQSSAALVQQVAAGSLGISISTGLADPLRAVGMGAPIAIVRLEVQAPPYDLVAKPGIAKLSDLKGKLISLGGPKDITRIYVERMLKPNGVNPGEFDMVFAGATAARASALLAGAVDAAILLPAFNFQAEAKGFNSLGLTVDYVKDLPFSGTAVNVAWAKAISRRWKNYCVRKPERCLVRGRGEPRRGRANTQNRQQLVAETTSRKHTTSSVTAISSSRPARSQERNSSALAKAMESLGDLPGALDIDKVVLPGVTQITD